MKDCCPPTHTHTHIYIYVNTLLIYIPRSSNILYTVSLFLCSLKILFDHHMTVELRKVTMNFHICFWWHFHLKNLSLYFLLTFSLSVWLSVFLLFTLFVSSFLSLFSPRTAVLQVSKIVNTQQLQQNGLKLLTVVKARMRENKISH